MRRTTRQTAATGKPSATTATAPRPCESSTPADPVADLQRRVTQLEQIVAMMAEQMADEQDDAPGKDLEGNRMPTFPKGGPLDTL